MTDVQLGITSKNVKWNTLVAAASPCKVHFLFLVSLPQVWFFNRDTRTSAVKLQVSLLVSSSEKPWEMAWRHCLYFQSPLWLSSQPLPRSLHCWWSAFQNKCPTPCQRGPHGDWHTFPAWVSIGLLNWKTVSISLNVCIQLMQTFNLHKEHGAQHDWDICSNY